MPKENILYSRLMWLKPIALMLYKDKFSSGFHTPDIIWSIRESDISCPMSCVKTAKLSLLMITMREMFEDLPGTYYQVWGIQKIVYFIQDQCSWIQPCLFWIKQIPVWISDNTLNAPCHIWKKLIYRYWKQIRGIKEIQPNRFFAKIYNSLLKYEKVY